MRIFSGILFVLIAALPYAAILRGGRPAEERAAAGAETLTILSPHRREVRMEYARTIGVVNAVARLLEQALIVDQSKAE